MKSLSCVWLFATAWTAANQAPPSMGFSRQKYRSGLPYASNSLGYISRHEIAKSYSNSMCNFWVTAKLFSTVATSFYILFSNVWGSQFLSIFIYACVCLFYWFQTSYWVWYCIYCGFDLYFLEWITILSIFSCAYWLFVYIILRNVYSESLLISKTSLSLFLSCKYSLYILNKSPMPDIQFVNVFFHSEGSFSTFLKRCPLRHGSFKFS